jgi:hypothetical protein
MPIPSFTPDAAGKLKDAGLVAATANWQVDATDKIFDLGAGPAWTTFLIQVQISALEVDTADELYRLLIQGSNESDFASDIVNLAELRVGATAVLDGDVASVLGQHLIAGHNEVGGVVYRYLRGRTVVSGSAVATGINFTAELNSPWQP